MESDGGPSAGWIDRRARLPTPVVADVLDRPGHRERAMRADIRPLFPEARAASVARTVRTIAPSDVAAAGPDQGEMAAVDDLKPGDVMVVSACDAGFRGEMSVTGAFRRHGILRSIGTRQASSGNMGRRM